MFEITARMSVGQRAIAFWWLEFHAFPLLYLPYTKTRPPGVDWS